MTTTVRERPPCFGDLDTVFPESEDGLRCSPEPCLACEHKTACLRLAMQGKTGLKIQEANLDRAHDAGMVGFLERWSKKKEIHRRLKEKNTNDQ